MKIFLEFMLFFLNKLPLILLTEGVLAMLLVCLHFHLHSTIEYCFKGMTCFDKLLSLYLITLCIMYKFSHSGFGGFHGTIDPEELFRKIFGDAGLGGFGKGMGGFSGFTDYEESKYGFAPASEVDATLS